ncbi:hypothetical protein [Nonomuraea jabiensis]|uniref:hypothetical protein n=1 Tax=Nonomuraea jabiensis TaxID=882448 RepID=UPI003D75216F
MRVRIATPAIRLTLTVLRGQRDKVNAHRYSLPDIPNLPDEALEWCLQHIPAGDATIWTAVMLEGEEVGPATPIAQRRILVPAFTLD